MTVLPDNPAWIASRIIEMQWGNPDPALLPTVELAEGVRRLEALVRENS